MTEQKFPYYDTPKGQDNRVYPMPERFKYLEDEGVKCLKYGHTLMLQGGGFTTKIIDEILNKQNTNQSVVTAATGYPGKGKTYGVMRIARKLDKHFHINDIPPPPPDEDDGQIAFNQKHLDYLTGPNTPLKRGQVIVIDEAHYGLSSRRWGDQEQQEIVDHIAAIRSKGFLLFLVVLHTEMIDKIIRKFVFNYEFYFPKRGQTTCYRKHFPRYAKEPYVKRLGKMNLLLPDEQLCNWLDCFKCSEKHPEYLDLKGLYPEIRCMSIRAIYERRKDHFLNQVNIERQEEHQESQYASMDDIMEYCVDNAQYIKDNLTKANGDLHFGNVISWLKDSGFNVKSREHSAVAHKILDEIL